MATRVKQFHERFGLEVGLDRARQRFVARAHNRIFEELFWEQRDAWGGEIYLAVADHIGDRVNCDRTLSYQIGTDFIRTLKAIEAMFAVAMRTGWAEQLDGAIRYLLAYAETDLGIRWDPPVFLPSGAKELDEKLASPTSGCNKARTPIRCRDGHVRGNRGFG